jgi:DNA-binding NtrC family response regulator
MQAKLLRVLEERVVTRLGSARSRPIDVRFVAATNRDLDADSRQGRMRSDLYFRINGVSLLIPPLRERPSDIEALAKSFLAACCRDLERPFPVTLSAATLDVLRRYAWPGNVRELRNAVERAAVISTETTIVPEDLPPSLLAALRTDRAQPSSHSNLQAEMKSLERERILETLRLCDGNQSEAARRLGIPRRTLVSRLTELGLTRRRSSRGEA